MWLCYYWGAMEPLSPDKILLLDSEVFAIFMTKCDYGLVWMTYSAAAGTKPLIIMNNNLANLFMCINL